MNNEFDEVKERVKIAISELIKKDFYILKNNSNESTISSTLHHYLKEQFKEFDVDCEYNRRQKEYPKKLNVSRGDKENSLVKPDIILHSRASTKNNYLVIEVKKTNNSYEEIIFDEIKLREFTSSSNKDDPTTEYNYSYGLAMIFNPNGNNV